MPFALESRWGRIVASCRISKTSARGVRMRMLFLLGWLLSAAIAVAQAQKSIDVVAFVSVDAPVFVLNHVRIIDGTGAVAKADQSIVIAHGKCQSIGPAASADVTRADQTPD